ncbi:DUF4271 domain-containing protein [Thalassobellus suaedae]|uniref:DUF4271 domain-containing protein n=1 Tax=Thalassobellus suaedae TaxID=3074124 RepID=A0ABY9Y626_9FLAO|nr:DUF4271 domain-containing protein [Flavobacteriaceae bacterium HL-DH10]
MIRDVSSNELFTILILFGIAIIAVAKLVAPKRFEDFLYVIGNFKYLKIYSREQKFFDNFDALLFINLIISVSIFSFIIYQHITGIQNVSINLIFKLTIGIGSFILIKVLIERLIGSIFEIDKIIDAYLFQKISYKNYLGLVLLPLNALLLFSFKNSLSLVYIIITLILIVNIIGLITSIKTHLNLIKGNFFYFILYLCALEITPYIILYKVFIDR